MLASAAHILKWEWCKELAPSLCQYYTHICEVSTLKKNSLGSKKSLFWWVGGGAQESVFNRPSRWFRYRRFLTFILRNTTKLTQKDEQPPVRVRPQAHPIHRSCTLFGSLWRCVSRAWIGCVSAGLCHYLGPCLGPWETVSFMQHRVSARYWLFYLQLDSPHASHHWEGAQ